MVISGIGHAAAVSWVINTATAARHSPAGGGAVTVTYLNLAGDSRPAHRESVAWVGYV